MNDVSDDQAALRYLCRHLVGLCVTYRHNAEAASRETDRVAFVSGTLLDIEGIILFLTAGHVLSEIDRLFKSSDCTVTSVQIVDSFGLNGVHKHPIPFDYMSADPLFIDDEEAGLDFGVLYIRPYYCGLLAANGVVAISKANWTHQESVRFDGYAVIGLPEELSSPRLLPGGFASTTPVMLGVVRLTDGDVATRVTKYPRFVGQIKSRIPGSITGMSGGPILGFNVNSDGELRYWIVAIQSSWLETSRTTFGCPVPVLARILTDAYEAEKEKLSRERSVGE